MSTSVGRASTGAGGVKTGRLVPVRWCGENPPNAINSKTHNTQMQDKRVLPPEAVLWSDTLVKEPL